MAILGTDSLTIVDITDGYTVTMSPESYAFPAGTTNALAGSVNVVVSAIQGNTPVDATVNLAEVTSPPGITVSKDSNVSTPTLTITIATSVTQPGVVIVPVHIGADVVITKRFVYSLAKTGSAGASGTSPVNVIMGNDSITIPTNASGSTTSASSVVIPFAGYQGTSRIAATVAVSGLPSGITAGTNTAATPSADGSLTLSTANASNLGGAASGNITLTFTAGGQNFVKYFSWAKAQTGATGSSGTSPYNIIVGNEDITIPANSAGNTISASTISIPFGGYQGTSRVAATVAASGMPSGITVQTNTAATTSADGNLVLAVANASSLGGTSAGVFTLTFTVGGQTFVRYFSWAKALAGSDGAPGQDAILLTVTSSGGTLFKNTSISTTLTARVFKGGAEVTGAALTALGTINWYKDGGTTAVATGSTLTITAGQVLSKAVYVAQLES